LDLIRALACKKPGRMASLEEELAGEEQLMAHGVQIFEVMGVFGFKTVQGNQSCRPSSPSTAS
jgi:adenine-specific DNA-methyltransferase